MAGLLGCQGTELAGNPPTICVKRLSSRLESYFRKNGWEWNNARGRWVGPTFTTDAVQADRSLLLWGTYDSKAGYWIDADRLATGASAQASALELAINSKDGIDSAHVAQAVHEHYGVQKGSILSRCSTIVEGRAGMVLTPFYEVASYTVGGVPAVWWLTMNGLGGVVVGCALLDYYARRKNVQPTYEDIGTLAGPWDLDIRRHDTR